MPRRRAAPAALQDGARNDRDRCSAAVTALPQGEYQSSTSSVSCSSRAKGTARASRVPLPGGNSGSASRICVAGAITITRAERATAAARDRGPRCRAAAGAPASSMLSQSVSS